MQNDRNYPMVGSPFISKSHVKVVPRNRGGLLRTWPLLIVILRISSTHFLQRVRVKNSKSGARARARVFFQDCVILPGGTQAKNSRKTCIVWTPPACFAPSVFLFSHQSAKAKTRFQNRTQQERFHTLLKRCKINPPSNGRKEKLTVRGSPNNG